jgi:hypothetical protein
MSKHDDNSPRCERCSDPVEEHGEHCPQCAALLLEWEIDEAWFVFLDSLKVGREWVEQIDCALTGWKYAGGKIERGITSKSLNPVVFRANELTFQKGEYFIQYKLQGKVPVVAIGDLDRDGWSAVFSFSTPINIILAAIAAI